ncbi:MAG: Smr/MutS family protein [Paracoccaceae bacterium]|nr:Smr/MutS family protein [Paracoccaceae bacterium]
MARKRRGLQPEEAALWDRVAGTARPLHPARKPAANAKAEAPSAHPPVPRPAPVPRFRLGEAAPEDGPRHLIQPGLSERLAGEPVRMDRKAFGRMTRGRLKPEAKIDLHGMTLAEAHPALVRFVLGAHSQGKRLVLVVTGKGRDRDEGGPIPAPRGILRHQVPLWLSQPPLAGLVLQLTEAHQRHGGSGAYYLYLRRLPGATVPRR